MRVSELVFVALCLREWVDAVPDDVILPAMPGFDRDWADEVIEHFRNLATWHRRDEALPEEGRRVLTYSPAYAERDNQAMMYRLMDSQFVRISTDVESWAYVEDLAGL